MVQKKAFVPVGGNQSIRFDLRLVSATNAQLHSMVHENKFREDLLYRINTVEINIPPLRKMRPFLIHTIIHLRSSERETLKLQSVDGPLQLSVAVKEFVLQYRLILLQNIQTETERIEVEAWQKLASVLTHEIMNSVTPIVSLSSALNTMMHDEKGNPKGPGQLTEEQITDIRESIQTVENRSKSLLEFVTAYREFRKPSVPEFKNFDLSVTLRRLY
ncbi:MAG: sigma 54-interacting transcriptional regulator [Cyclobacteriaceae bacterium]|nr:sigma 54-interacting transcriptional regulator [Cyclobacteriaceae bacterium]